MLANLRTNRSKSMVWHFFRNCIKFLGPLLPIGTKRRAFFELLLRHLIGVDFYCLSRNEQYQFWLKNNLLTETKILELHNKVKNLRYKPKISVIMPVYNTESRWLREAIDSLLNQIYPNWQLCIADDASSKEHIRKILRKYSEKDNRIDVKYLKKNLGIAGATNEALNMASGEFVGFLDHDDEITSDALFEIVKLLNYDNKLDLIYSDEDKKDSSGRRIEPFFKPDWSPDLLLSMNYISHFTVIRRELIEQAGRLRSNYDGSQDYDLILRVTELTNMIGHIPKPLYNWRAVPGSAATAKEAKPYARKSAKKALEETLNRRKLSGEVLDGFGGHYRIKYAIRGEPLVSIIIPSKDKVSLLKKCLESIELKTSYRNYEIIIIDDNSIEEKTLNYYKTLNHKVLRFNEPFNFSKINNFGATQAKGEHLLFLNNDTEIIEEDWLNTMLEHSQRQEVGMVGSLLLYPGQNSKGHRMIQHAGVVLGLGGIAGHVFKHLPFEEMNYFALHRVSRNCSAVTAACAMIRKDVFIQVGGFDENLKVAYGDIDLCLRVRENGYLIVCTPYAILHHHECATRGDLHPPEDEKYMMNKWFDALMKGDPYYNLNLTLLKENSSITPKGAISRPLAALNEIYFITSKLQKDYPEVKRGNYSRLFSWAIGEGLTMPEFKYALAIYRSWYESQI